MTATDDDPFIGMREVCAMTGLSESTVRNYHSAGRRAARLNGGAYRPEDFPPADHHELRDFVKHNGQAGAVNTPRWRTSAILAYMEARGIEAQEAQW